MYGCIYVGVEIVVRVKSIIEVTNDSQGHSLLNLKQWLQALVFFPVFN